MRTSHEACQSPRPPSPPSRPASPSSDGNMLGWLPAPTSTVASSCDLVLRGSHLHVIGYTAKFRPLLLVLQGAQFFNDKVGGWVDILPHSCSVSMVVPELSVRLLVRDLSFAHITATVATFGNTSIFFMLHSIPQSPSCLRVWRHPPCFCPYCCQWRDIWLRDLVNPKLVGLASVAERLAGLWKG